MNQWWTHKTLKKINANAPAKTLHFISSPRSICHTIKPGLCIKISSVNNFTSMYTPQLFCFEDFVFWSNTIEMFTSKVSNRQYFRRHEPGFKELYSPRLFWLLVNYYILCISLFSHFKVLINIWIVTLHFTKCKDFKGKCTFWWFFYFQ